MWDCRYRDNNDYCKRRKAACFPGGIACVLKGKFVFPLRPTQDPLEQIQRKKFKSYKKKWKIK